MFRFFICSICLLVSVLCRAEGQDYDVYLLIGQSNMAGRGELKPKDCSPVEGVWLLKTDGTIEPAACPMNRYSTIRKGIEMQKMSPAYSFGKTLHKVTGRKILLVVNARGGSAIEEWKKGNGKTLYYEEAVRRTKEALRYGTLKGVLWHQGESNIAGADRYIEQLIAIIENLRKDFDNERLPFIAGEIAHWNAGASVMNAAIRSLPARVEHTGYVTSEGARPLKDFGDPHFNRKGSMLMGKRYARKILEMVYGIK